MIICNRRVFFTNKQVLLTKLLHLKVFFPTGMRQASGKNYKVEVVVNFQRFLIDKKT